MFFQIKKMLSQKIGNKLKYLVLIITIPMLWQATYSALQVFNNTMLPLPGSGFNPTVMVFDEQLSELFKLKEIGPRERFDADDWRFILVNFENDMPADYNVNLKAISGSYKVDERIYDDLKAMLDAAKADGIDMYVCSAYRTYDYQKNLLARKTQQYIDRGYSRQRAAEIAQTIVAKPGQSEHNLGLAVDIASAEHRQLDEGFESTAAYAWLQENSCEYGFIMRYPEDKQDLTGIIYEPWHYRYVGQAAANYINENALCLEEFVELLK